MRQPKRPAIKPAAKRVPPNSRRWAVYRIGKPQKFVGFVPDTPDEATARRLAILEYRVPDRWHGHLIAYRKP
jgi:hypothetical protein